MRNAIEPRVAWVTENVVRVKASFAPVVYSVVHRGIVRRSLYATNYIVMFHVSSKYNPTLRIFSRYPPTIPLLKLWTTAATVTLLRRVIIYSSDAVNCFARLDPRVRDPRGP